VQRFCELGLIDCVSTTGEKGTTRYFVNPRSVERYADELKQLQTISHVGDALARNDAPERDTARQDATPVPAPVAAETRSEPDHAEARARERVVQLEKENFQLRIDSAARADVINQMRDHERTWLTQLTEQSREIGRLEMQVRQLAAPKEDVAHNGAPEAAMPVMEPEEDGREVRDAEQAPVMAAKPEPEPEQRRPWWRR